MHIYCFFFSFKTIWSQLIIIQFSLTLQAYIQSTYNKQTETFMHEQRRPFNFIISTQLSAFHFFFLLLEARDFPLHASGIPP